MMVLQDTGRVGFSRWSLLEDEEQRDDVRPYLAPEFDKQERSDPTSDVYTLGVILRLIVTGSPTSETTVSRPLFEALIDRATDPEPSKRFGDARVFRDALDGVLRDGGSDETLAAAYDLATSMRKRYRQLNTEAVLARKNGSLDKHKEYVQRIERLHHQLVGCLLYTSPSPRD